MSKFSVLDAEGQEQVSHLAPIVTEFLSADLVPDWRIRLSAFLAKASSVTSARRSIPLVISSGPSRQHAVVEDSSSPTSSDGGNRFECLECTRSFSRRYDLKRHVEIHHLSMRNYACQECNATFTHKGHLSQHIKCVHERRKDHVCHVCGQGFSVKSNMKRHILRNHPGSPM